MRVQDVHYEADGRLLVGTLATPDGPGPHPAVLIGHEGPGLDEVQRGRAAQVAAFGYIGFAHPGASRAGIPGIAYDEAAAADSWRGMTNLLRQTFA